MLSRILTVVPQAAESALSVLGIRIGTEEPSFTAEDLIDGVQIRRYGPRIAAQTTVVANEEAARSAGFRRLAGYIFGKNHQAQTIAMTAPVTQTSQRIAMTAPVAQEETALASGAQGWTIRFFMPAKWTMDTLPTPDDERVELVTVPAETVAVLRFTGDRGAASVAARSGQLLDVLRRTGFEPAGQVTAWFYDPPWTIPFLRRNEVVVAVETDRG